MAHGRPGVVPDDDAIVFEHLLDVGARKRQRITGAVLERRDRFVFQLRPHELPTNRVFRHQHRHHAGRREVADVAVEIDLHDGRVGWRRGVRRRVNRVDLHPLFSIGLHADDAVRPAFWDRGRRRVSLRLCRLPGAPRLHTRQEGKSQSDRAEASGRMHLRCVPWEG